MIIKNLKIKNFKSIKQMEIEFSPIVGFWGPNGAGKSTILQAILLPAFPNLPNFFASYGYPAPKTAKSLIYKNENVNLDVQILYEDGKSSEIEIDNTGRTKKIKQPPHQNLIRYFPPWRKLSSRSSSPATKIEGNFIINSKEIHSYLHWFGNEKMREKLKTGKENEYDRINYWAKKLGYGEISDKHSSHNVVMGMYHDEDLDIDVSLLDGGYGGNTFLPIILEGYSFKNGVLLIEEPEISLHPAAQSEILDFFIEMMEDRGHQIIFTSHSDYLLRRIIRKYKEGILDEEKAQVMYVEKDEEGTHAYKQSLEGLKDRYEERKDIIPELKKRIS